MSVRVLLVLICIAMIAVPAVAAPVVKYTPAPFGVFSIKPSEGIAGSTGEYLVQGNGFTEGASFGLWGFDAGIPSMDVLVINSSHIQGTISIPASADLGLYSIHANNPPWTQEYAYRLGVFTVIAPPPGIIQVPEGGGVPTDSDGDREFDDVNGNGRKDFADVVLYFNQMTWIAANEPLSAFDYNDNGRVDFADVVWHFDIL